MKNTTHQNLLKHVAEPIMDTHTSTRIDTIVFVVSTVTLSVLMGLFIVSLGAL